MLLASFDLYRILLGDKPPTFLFEVAFRTVVIYGYTLVLLRWMGKRGMGSLSPFEFAIIVALGSAVGDPMFYDDVPLVHTMLVIAIIVGMQRGLSWLTERNHLAERLIESSPRLLVIKGVIHVDNLHQERLSHDELFQSLREEGVRHLGEVDGAYLEPSGRCSVIRATEPRSGLSVLPQDPSLIEGPGRAALAREANGRNDAKSSGWCCEYCGHFTMAATQPAAACPNCQHETWQAAWPVSDERGRENAPTA